MVVPFVSLPVHVYQADMAAQTHLIQQNAATNQAAVAGERVQEQARQDASQQVAETSQVDNPIIDAEARGSHSHTLPEQKKEEPAPEPQEPIREAPDPTGRGTVLDVSI